MTAGSQRGSRARDDLHGVDGPNETASAQIERPEGALGSQAATGILWTSAQKWVVRIAGLGTLAILTRIVTPAEFGVVAAAMTLLPFFYLISDLGFSTFLVQSERLDHRVLSTGMWFSVAAGVALTLATFVAAPLVSALMRIPDLTQVLRVLSVSVLVSALTAVPTALLRRRMRFRALAVQGVIAAVAAQVVAVVLALSDFGVWALVAQLLVMQAVAMALAWHAARWLPSFQFSAALFRSMAAFGARVSAAEFVAAARLWAEATIVASTLGATALGYLSIAQRLVAVVQELSTAAVMPVSIVVFARLRDTRPRLIAGYGRGLSLAYTVVAPLLTLVAVTAPVLVPLLFGDQWGASIQVAQLLAVAAILTLGAIVDHGLLYGLGRPGRWLRYAVLVDLLTVGVTAVAVQRGLTAVALGFLCVAFGATLARWVMVSRVLECPVRTISRPFAYMTVTTGISGAVGLLTMNVLTTGWPAFAQVSVTGLMVVASSLAVVRLLRPDVLAYAIETLSLPASIRRRARRIFLLLSIDSTTTS